MATDFKIATRGWAMLVVKAEAVGLIVPNARQEGKLETIRDSLVDGAPPGLRQVQQFGFTC